MSAFTVVFHRDGRPVQGADLAGPHEAAAHRGPDGAGIFTDGPVGLGLHLFVTTPEAVGDTHPRSRQGCTVVFDGRLDNRDDLRAMLGDVDGLAAAPDSEYALRAYLEWGLTCPTRLLGDFAFAVWDERKRSIFLARDQLGVRPLYWLDNGHTFVAGTEIGQMLAHPASIREPNPRPLAGLLTNSLSGSTETFYRGIFRLAPAHSLTVSLQRAPTAVRYWSLTPSGPRARLSPAACVDEFMALLSEAVRARSRGPHPIGVNLSGGLDSSLVLATAADLAGGGGVAAFTVGYPGHECDEVDLARRTAEALDVRLHVTPWQPRTLGELSRLTSECRYLPPYPQAATEAIAASTSATGVRVVLTGQGGDEIGFGTDSHFADLLRDGHLGHLARTMFAHRRNPALLASNARSLARHATPRRALHAWRRAAGRDRTPGPSWLGPRLSTFVPATDDSEPASATAERIRWLTGPWHSLGCELTDLWVARIPTEYRHPFLDRRLVEWAVDTPDALRWRDTDNRWFERQAGYQLLPLDVVEAVSKPDYRSLSTAELADLGEAPVAAIQALGAKDWVKTAAAEAALQHAVGTGSLEPHDPFRLWLLVGIDAWIRCVTRPLTPDGRNYPPEHR